MPADGGSAVHAVTSVGASPSRRAWLRFRRNRLGFWSLVVFCVLVVLSLGAELVSNDRPLVVRYEGQTYFPIARDYAEKTGLDAVSIDQVLARSAPSLCNSPSAASWGQRHQTSATTASVPMPPLSG